MLPREFCALAAPSYKHPGRHFGWTKMNLVYPQWFTEQDLDVFNRWVSLVNRRSLVEKFALICEGSSSTEAEVREMLVGSCGMPIEELDRVQVSLRMNSPRKSSRIYLLTSIPSRIQQSRLSSWLNRDGNHLLIFVRKFDESLLDWRDDHGLPLEHEVIRGPIVDDDW